MRKVVLNDKQLYNMAYLDMMAKYPNDTKEMLAQKARDAIPYVYREMLKVNCVHRMREFVTSGDDFIIRKTEELIDDMPEVLFPNLEEWLDHKPISELTVGNLSLKQIMDYTGEGFYDCMILMVKYVNSGCSYSETSILNYFASLHS